MTPLLVQGLCKAYPSFALRDVTFSLEPGKITGFIGRNGAGKSTTLKSLFDIVHPDAGEVSFFGLPFSENAQNIKQRVGFVAGGVDYYPRKPIKTISSVTRMFYERWDEAAYRRYLREFGLDERKSPAQLSAGMKVKYALTLALSHRAELLILDEPTTGLDPVARDELLDLLLSLSRQGVTILFSTHITSDLDKCADNLLYLSSGILRADCPVSSFIEGYRMLAVDGSLPPALEANAAGLRRTKTGCTVLLPAAEAAQYPGAAPVDLEQILVHLERRESCENF